MLFKDLHSVTALAKNVIHPFKHGEVALGKSFLVGNENIGMRGIDPAGEDAFEEDVGIKALF